MSRRTQSERSAGTRRALMDAALDVLIERGWTATTAVEVCARAGVTRGALVHHFPSVASLLAGALQHQYEEMARRAPPRPEDLAGLIDNTWGALSDRRFKAVLEVLLAMGNDPALRPEVGPVVAGFAKLVDPDEYAPGLLTTDAQHHYYLMAREALLGLALGRATNNGQPLPHEPLVLTQLRTGAHALTPDTDRS